MARSTYARAVARQAPKGAVVLAPRPAPIARLEPEPAPEWVTPKPARPERADDEAPLKKRPPREVAQPEAPAQPAVTRAASGSAQVATVMPGPPEPSAPAQAERIEIVEEKAPQEPAGRTVEEPAAAVVAPAGRPGGESRAGAPPATSSQAIRGEMPPSAIAVRRGVPRGAPPRAPLSDGPRGWQAETPPRPPVETPASPAAPAAAREKSASPAPVINQTTVIREQPAGGVRIGTIEVRVTPAPAAPPAPARRRAAPAPKAPLARGYSPLFGWGQQ